MYWCETKVSLLNSPLTPISLLHCTQEHFFTGYSVVNVCPHRWTRAIVRAQKMVLSPLGPTKALATTFPHFLNTSNCKPLLPTCRWAFVWFNRHKSHWKYALCSTKGNSNIIRNHYIPNYFSTIATINVHYQYIT